MPFGLLEFPGIDSNDKYIADCSAEGCTKKHNILKNDMLLSGDQVMNWLDFLDVLECYENAAECGVCTKCSWCKYYFKTLLAEAWGLREPCMVKFLQQWFSTPTMKLTDVAP